MAEHEELDATSDDLDPCGEEIDFAEDPVDDNDLDGFVLFAGAEDDPEGQAAAWEELFNA